MIDQPIALLGVLLAIAALAFWLEGRFGWAQKAGASLLIIIFGALLSNLDVVPATSPVTEGALARSPPDFNSGATVVVLLQAATHITSRRTPTIRYPIVMPYLLSGSPLCCGSIRILLQFGRHVNRFIDERLA